MIDTELLNQLMGETIVESSEGEMPEPFSITREEYQYFQPRVFADGMVMTPQLDQEARSLLADETEEHDFHIKLGFPEFADDHRGDAMIGEATLEFQSGYNRTVLQFNREKVIYHDCNFWRCRDRRYRSEPRIEELCVHEAAAFLLLQQELKHSNIGDATNRLGNRFLQGTFGMETPMISSTEQKPCELVPVLIRTDERLVCSFRCYPEGEPKRGYKLKDIPEFINAVKNCEPIPFGKRWNPIIPESRFTENGQRWFQMMCQILDAEKEHSSNFIQVNRSWYFHDIEMRFKSELPLYGRWLDQFFANAFSMEKLFTYQDQDAHRKPKYEIVASDDYQRPQIVVDAAYDDQDFQGISIDGQIPNYIAGEEYGYILTDTALTQVDYRLYAIFSPMQDAISDGSFHAVLGRNHIRYFFRNMLPKLQEVTDVTVYQEDVIRKYLPIVPTITYFLDVDDNNIMARGIVDYQGKRHNLTDLRERRILESYRDPQIEQKAIDAITEYLPNVDEVEHVFFDEEEDALYRLVRGGMDVLFQVGEVHSTDRFKRIGVSRKVPLQIGVSVQHDLLDLTIHSDAYSDDELLGILQAYRSKKRFYRLQSGDFLQLDEDMDATVEHLSELMDSMGMTPKQFVEGKMQLPAYRALYLNHMMEEFEGVYTKRDQHFRGLIRDIEEINPESIVVPETLRPVLRGYQARGYRWMRTLDQNGLGGILADDMGLGKTLQMIAVLLSTKGDMPSLIVAPASLVYNWYAEITRFAPELSVTTVAGTKKDRSLFLKSIAEGDAFYDVIITSYDLLKRDIDLYEPLQFHFQVLDEAQYIKNARTAVARSVKLIHAKTRFALTGTPIENKLSDLWSIFDFLMPGYLFDYDNFRMRFEGPIIRGDDYHVKDRLQAMIGPFLLRRLKKDVLLDLPDKLEEVQYAEMEKHQQTLYDAQVLRIRQELEAQSDADFKQNHIRILAELMKLRQICCDPSLCLDGYKGGSAKKNLCLEMIQNAVEGGHKVLLFSQFTTMLSLLEEALDHAGIPYYLITGATAKKKRLQLVEQFNRDDTPVFLISLKAGGTGLNLTGADIVIHYDPWWNFAAQDQATDRAHRIGQENVVTVYKLIMKGTIEEKILQLQEEKQKLADEILTANEFSGNRLNRTDLLKLLR